MAHFSLPTQKPLLKCLYADYIYIKVYMSVQVLFISLKRVQELQIQIEDNLITLFYQIYNRHDTHTFSQNTHPNARTICE